MKLSVLAGIVGSDGHLTKNESAVVIVNKDMEFLKKEVLPLLKSLTDKPVSVSWSSSGYGDGKYLVRVWDKELQQLLCNKYGIPRGKKDGIKLPRLPPREMMYFILGWIAGDGSVTSDRGRPKIEIWSKDAALIKKFFNFLVGKGMRPRIFDASNGRKILRLGRSEDLRKFSRHRIPHPAKNRKLKNFLAPADAGFSTS